jgi:hypothetical protein
MLGKEKAQVTVILTALADVSNLPPHLTHKKKMLKEQLPRTAFPNYVLQITGVP